LENTGPYVEICLCPSCGSIVNETVAACPDCESALGDEYSFGDISELETLAIDSSVFICSNCGAFIGVDAANCGACGAKRTPLTAEIEISASDDALSEAALESGGSPGIFLCDNCGAFLSEDASECEICGMNFENLNLELPEEEYEDEEYELFEDNIVDDILHNEGALFLCKNCGAFVKTDSADCGICGENISSHEDLALDEQKNLPTAEEKLSSPGVLYLCDKCGAFMKDDATECPFCRAKKDDVKKKIEEEFETSETIASQVSLEVPRAQRRPKKKPSPRPKIPLIERKKRIDKKEVIEDCLKLWLKKAVALKQMGKPKEALKALNYALNLNSQDMVAIQEKADLLYECKNFVKAAQLYKQILNYKPEDISIWNKLGNALYRMGHEEESLLCYEKSLSLDSENRDAIINKGYILMKQEKWKEAMEIADSIAS
jgi:tetratricopeptide (TPR) repeat protein